MIELTKREFISLLKEAENKDKVKIWSSWAGDHTKEDILDGLSYDEYIEEFEIENDELIYVEDFELDFIYNAYKNIIDKNNKLNGEIKENARFGEYSIIFTFDENILISLEYDFIDNEASSVKYSLEPKEELKEEPKEELAKSESINRLLNKFK